MRYRSSVLLMFRQFIVAALVATTPTALFLGFVTGVENPAVVVATVSAVALACALYTVYSGYVDVTVTDEAILVARPRRPVLTVDREGYSFSSRIKSQSVNFIPVSTSRFLKVFNDKELFEIELPNLSKRSFDSLVAGLRARRVAEEAKAEGGLKGMAETRFVVPREGMLADHRSLAKRLGIGIVVVLAGAFVFLLYKLPPQAVQRGAVTLLAGTFMMIPVCIALPLFLNYRKCRALTPAEVSLDGRWLVMGDDRIALDEIQRIVATPPEYGGTDWTNVRKMTVTGDRGGKTYLFGVRRTGGVWKTIFTEYGEMCGGIERTAAARGIEFVYDL